MRERRGRDLNPARKRPSAKRTSGGRSGEPGGSPDSASHAGAERAGFEPATHLSARTRFPVALLRPLGHLSVLRSGEGGIRTLDAGIHPHNALAGRRLQPLGHFSGFTMVSQAFRRPATIPLPGYAKIPLRRHAGGAPSGHAVRAGSPLTYPTGLERPLRRAFPFPGQEREPSGTAFSYSWRRRHAGTWRKGKTMRILRSKKAIVAFASTAIGAAALAATGLSGIISQSIVRDSTNVHLRVVRSVADVYDSGWHIHPGPAVVQVQEGSFQITQGSCTPQTVSAGQTFVEVPFLPVRGVASGRVAWTTTLLGPYEDALLTPVASPCP